MAAADKIRNLNPNAIANGVGTDNVRAPIVVENNKRTERIDCVVTAQVDITVAGAGIVNAGSILGALRGVGFSDGGVDKINMDARMARFIGEAMAPSALPAVRLAAAGVQAATILTESFPLWLSAPKTANMNETKYVEVNKQLQLQAFVTPLKLITGVAEGAALAGTITNMTFSAQQRYDDMVGTSPWLTTYQRTVTENVNAANANLRIDLRGSRFLRGIAIQQDTNQGEVADIINSLVLRGDAVSQIGDGQVPFAQLQQSMAEEQGGQLRAPYLWIDFARYGRLSTLYNPYQDTNLRLELNVQPSVTVFSGAAATGSVVRVGLVEYEATAATLKTLPIEI